jgi:hypothetical protein
MSVPQSKPAAQQRENLMEEVFLIAAFFSDFSKFLLLGRGSQSCFNVLGQFLLHLACPANVPFLVGVETCP